MFGGVSAEGEKVTRVFFTSRPFLTSQRYIIGKNFNTINVDSAPDDGEFVTHTIQEVEKVIVPIPLSTQVEMHSKIKSLPFRDALTARFIVRPPPGSRSTGPRGRIEVLTVHFQFTIRSGCSVQLQSTEAGSVDVVIVLDPVGYKPFKLPDRNDKPWSKEELERLNSGARGGFKTVTELSAAIAVLEPGVGPLRVLEVLGVLNRDILSDEYDTIRLRSQNILDASHALSAPADNIPPIDPFEVNDPNVPNDKKKGVIIDDTQPYPVFGWLELKFTEPEPEPV